MTPSLDTPAPRLLRVGLHLLVAALLLLAAARAVADGTGRGSAALVLTAVVAMAACYTLGALLSRSERAPRSPRAVRAWLAALTLSWVVLLALTPDGIWLAFPLFFVELALLSRTAAVVSVAATTMVAVVGFGWHAHELTPATITGPVIGAAVAVAVVLGYQGLSRESEERRRLIEELTATRDELAHAERNAGVLAERERLAREIHDTLAQGLSSIQLLLRAAERGLPDRPDIALDHVRNARQAAAGNLAEARRFVRALAPPDLDGGSLPGALARLCTRTSARDGGPPVRFLISGPPVRLPVPQEVALLRIAQSALANMVWHADAEHAEVTLSYMTTEVALDVVDDGRGFDPDAVPLPDGVDGIGYGLSAMRARASALRGDLAVESAPGEGTAVSVRMPYCGAEQPAGTRGERRRRP